MRHANEGDGSLLRSRDYATVELAEDDAENDGTKKKKRRENVLFSRKKDT